MGIDTSGLVHDPVFQSLTLAGKVDAIKKYAQRFQSGISLKTQKSEYAPALVDAGFGAASGALGAFLALKKLAPLAGSMSAAEKFIKNRATVKTYLLAAGMGAMINSLPSLSQVYDNKNAKLKAHNILQGVINNPTDAQGISAISALSRNKPGIGLAIKNRLLSSVVGEFNAGRKELPNDIYKNVYGIDSKEHNKLNYPHFQIPETF